MSSPIEQAIRQIVDEKGLSYESVIDAIESALAAAYRKDFGDKLQNIETQFNVQDGSVRVFDVKTVVEDIDLEEVEAAEEERRARVEALAANIESARERGNGLSAVSMEDDLGPRFNPKTELMLSVAKEMKTDAQIGDVLRSELAQPGEFGRMAAMTAKQVITQKLREAEREIVFSEFKEKEHQVVTGTVQRKEGRVILVDLGRTTAILRGEDQIPTERYNPGSRLKFYVRQVSLTNRGPEILLSRSNEELVQALFMFEIPEVSEGVVVLKAIAREAGSRSKVAVWTTDEQVDPIGACIGQRGTRIQTIIGELGGEKIDIIEWNADPRMFIPNALSPAVVLNITLDENTRIAVAEVASDQLSLAIGKGGQNVRLAARLTGWSITVSGAEDTSTQYTQHIEAQKDSPDETSAVVTAPEENT